LSLLADGIESKESMSASASVFGSTRAGSSKQAHSAAADSGKTICAPCGAVIAWTLFDKAESPTHILHFLEAVYPTPDLRPNYVCIDKACAVLRTYISNGAWNTWNQTTWFIVDSYHYIHHRTTDYLCR
jgi:hypothetical protein